MEHADDPPPRPHPVRRIGSALLGVLLMVFLAVAAAVAVVPALTGGRAMTVLSGSMEPALPVGSVVVARPRPAGTVEPGHVITYTDRDPDSPATRVVTHRVVDVQPGPGGPTFGTKGDANDVPDEGRVAAADLIGVQWYAVPYAGTAREFLKTTAGLSYLVGTLLALLAAHLLLPRHARPSEPAATGSTVAGADALDDPTTRLPVVDPAQAHRPGGPRHTPPVPARPRRRPPAPSAPRGHRTHRR